MRSGHLGRGRGGRKVLPPERAARSAWLGHTPTAMVATASAMSTGRMATPSSVPSWARSCTRGFMYMAMITGR